MPPTPRKSAQILSQAKASQKGQVKKDLTEQGETDRRVKKSKRNRRKKH